MSSFELVSKKRNNWSNQSFTIEHSKELMSCPLSCLQSRYDAKSGNRCLNQLCLESDSDFPSHSWIDLDMKKTSWTPNFKIPMIGNILKPNGFQEAFEEWRDNDIFLLFYLFWHFLTFGSAHPLLHTRGHRQVKSDECWIESDFKTKNAKWVNGYCS